VSPCVRYGMACLLIRNTIGSVSYSDECGLAWYFTQTLMVQEGLYWGNHNTASGAFVGETIAKNDILL
jgi:hypothetical protein